jgi:hypothetical protein
VSDTTGVGVRLGGSGVGVGVGLTVSVGRDRVAAIRTGPTMRSAKRAPQTSGRRRESRTVATTLLGVLLFSGCLVWSQTQRAGSGKESRVSDEKTRAMQALGFMVGEWNLDYTVEQGGKTSSDLRGSGSLRYLFDGTYLSFDYDVQDKKTSDTVGGAHAVFAWDSKAGEYRFYWFESSGTFLQATASLRDAETLFLQWQGNDCTQIFRRVGDDAMFLEMKCPGQALTLRVDFSRKPIASKTR